MSIFKEIFKCQPNLSVWMIFIEEVEKENTTFVVQWIFDLRKFLGTAKNFFKSKIFLKSNTPSSLKYANWKYYIYFYDPIYSKEYFQMLFIVK